MKKLILPLVAAVLTGCATYKKPTSDYYNKENSPYGELRERALTNRIYEIIPLKREQIKWYDFGHLVSWNIAGNEGDGIFGEKNGARTPYSTNINFTTFCSWQLRNPLHNFCFYTIGSADWKKHYNFALFQFDENNKMRMFSDRSEPDKKVDAFLDFGFNDFKPYFKFKPLFFDFYFGWRRNGSFEIKARTEFKKAKEKKIGAEK